MDVTNEDEFIVEQLKSGVMKRCPFCGIPSELGSGCNYVTCFCKLGRDQKSEWCFLCGRPKWSECNDQSHNSH